METRHPVDSQFGREFPAICKHCGVMTASNRKTWKWSFVGNLRFFGKTTRYVNIFKILFRKFTWRQWLTLLCSNVVQNFPTGNRALLTVQKKFRLRLRLLLLRGSAQNLPGPAPNIWLLLFQISSNSVHFRWSYSRTCECRSFVPITTPVTSS